MNGGRKPKLNEEQLSQAWARHLNGEPLESIAKSFGTTKGSLSKNFAGRKGELKEAAMDLVHAQQKIASFPEYEQKAVMNFANEFKEISYHLGSAAKYGAMTAHRMSMIAQLQSERVSDVDPLGESAQELQAVAVLMKTANESSLQGRDLVKSTKEEVGRTPQEQAADIKKYLSALDEDVIDADS